MYLNSALTRLICSEKDAGMGYRQKIFKKTNEVYKIDKQPYSEALAKKEYGLTDEGIMYRCFTEKKGLGKGDYVACEGLFYLVLMVNDWENHSEIILGKVSKD